MQSENFDKKIRDSLSQRPPGNDNPGWDKMEVLLDKHMPAEKKDRRRFFFILLFLFLLTGGGAFLIWQNGNEDRDKNNVTDNRSQGNNTVTTVDNKPTSEVNDAVINKIKPGAQSNDLNVQIDPVTHKSTVPEKPITANEDSKKIEFSVIDPPVSKKPSERKSDKPISKNLIADEKADKSPVGNMEPGKKQIESDKEIKIGPVSAEKSEVEKKEEIQKPTIDNKIDEQKTEPKDFPPITTKKTDPKKQTGKSSFLNNLFFSVSAGPDFSSVGFDNAGKLEMAYGAGIGYKISKKFSIRTGFYTARKIYTAGPEDYYMPYNIAQYYPNLKSIDANCEVYELPVVLDYTISNNKKGSWFVSGGVSSLLMKEETYEYYFKPNYSPTYVTYTKTFKDENKHYFSQLNISGGYTRNFNKNISLRAEPYIKIAMNGIGAGKVDLNSGGVLFSAIIKPFAKN